MQIRPPPRTVEVLRTRRLSPHMLRVTLGGPGLEGFPPDADGGYIKLRLHEPETSVGAPVLRTYTVREYDAGAGRMDVDFVIHDSDGPAVDWARNCRPGDSIRIGGPGLKAGVDPAADWYLFVGDMSALPAIATHLEQLPRTARGYALLEIMDAADRQALNAPAAIDVRWLVNSEPERDNHELLDAVRAVDWLPGRAGVWVAGEFSQSLAIRAFLKTERGVTREQSYFSSYWQIGQTEDGHRVSKRNAAED